MHNVILTVVDKLNNMKTIKPKLQTMEKPKTQTIEITITETEDQK